MTEAAMRAKSEPAASGPSTIALPFTIQPAEMISKSLEIRGINPDQRTADFIASTDVVDSYGEIIDQESWVLDDYLKNPVALFAHKSHELPIGRCIDCFVRNGRLECTIEFAPEDMNPEAERVWKMVRAKYLRAVSVGFLPRKGKYEMRDGKEIWVWSGCVLKEISVTPVPANPEALAKMKALFAERDSVESPLTEQTKALRASAKDSPAASPGDPTDGDVERKATKMDELKEARDKIEKQAAAIAEKAVEAKQASERAERAEKALEDVAAREKALLTEKAALESQNAALVKERDAANSRAAAAEEKSIDQEVEALVGKKITAAEKPLFVDLRKSNQALFEKMVEQRAPLRLETEIVPPSRSDDGVDDLIKEVNGGAR